MQINNDMDGFEKIVLTASDGAEVEFCRYGGHVTAWRPLAGAERLFMSRRAVFRTGVAIRGGVPVCFPQFAEEGPLLKHGFARLCVWDLLRTEKNGSDARAVLQLLDSDATRAAWPYPFRITLTITVGGPRLLLEFAVQNTGNEPFTFTGALHTYLKVNDITETVVEDLAGVHYQDAVAGLLDAVQMAQAVDFPCEVDRVYRNAPKRLVVREPARQMIVQGSGFPDVVVWNPGPVRCAALADMELEGYREMVCVEAAAVSVPVQVQPGETWHGAQELIAP
jgi:glucose-6-phosphate 1-epimerase